MSKFKVGDYVNNSTYGIGVVKEVCFEVMPQLPYKVAFENCWHWMREDSLTLSKPVKEFIVIRCENRDVIASHKRGDEIVKTAKATCAPNDEFNFETGAKLAFDRLMGRQNIDEAIKAWNEPSPAPEPKYYSGKVFAVRTKEDDATPRMQNRVGHVFEIKDGFITGLVWNFDLGQLCPFNSFSEFCKYCSATEWQEVKE